MNFTIVKIVRIRPNQGMEPLQLPTEEEVRAADHQVEKAVVELVVGLVKDWVGVIKPVQYDRG